MEVHAEYFLKCNEAAKWLNTPQPVSGVPKEFLDGAHAVTSSILAGVCPTTDHSPPSTCKPATAARSEGKRPRAPPPCAKNACSSTASGPVKPAKFCPKPIPSADGDVNGLDKGFPSLTDLAAGKSFVNKSLLYVPVELYDHFVFGVVVGCPVPPPDGVNPKQWTPLVTRFVLDAGRKCCLMFSYFAEGSIVVLVDCFDEVGDHFSEITFFEPTPVVGVFPRGITGRMQIFEKRDCPSCTAAAVSCSCPVNQRVEAIVKMRQARVATPGHGPAHAGSFYKDENVVIHTYPYWAQVLDEYKWSRIGSYCVQIRYTPAPRKIYSASSAQDNASQQQPQATTLAYRTSTSAEPRVTVDKMLRHALFNNGVSALKPPATDVQWETSSTTAVNAKNEIVSDSDSLNAVCFTDLHKLPGFQEDYLLVAPSNIVSGAKARAELARAEAERLAARARVGVPVLPSWASGRMGVFEHILNESGPELDGLFADLQESTEFQESRDAFQNQMFTTIPDASVGTVMRPRNSGDRKRASADRIRNSADRARNSADRARNSADRARTSAERAHTSADRVRSSAERNRQRGSAVPGPRASVDDNGVRQRLPPAVMESNCRKRKDRVLLLSPVTSSRS